MNVFLIKLIRLSDNVVVQTYLKEEDAEKEIIFYDCPENPHRLEYFQQD